MRSKQAAVVCAKNLRIAQLMGKGCVQPYRQRCVRVNISILARGQNSPFGLERACYYGLHCYRVFIIAPFFSLPPHDARVFASRKAFGSHGLLLSHYCRYCYQCSECTILPSRTPNTIHTPRPYLDFLRVVLRLHLRHPRLEPVLIGVSAEGATNGGGTHDAYGKYFEA